MKRMVGKEENDCATWKLSWMLSTDDKDLSIKWGRERRSGTIIKIPKDLYLWLLLGVYNLNLKEIKLRHVFVTLGVVCAKKKKWNRQSVLIRLSFDSLMGSSSKLGNAVEDRCIIFMTLCLNSSNVPSTIGPKCMARERFFCMCLMVTYKQQHVSRRCVASAPAMFYRLKKNNQKAGVTCPRPRKW